MSLYQLIKDGFDRDTVVFDREAKGISKRLLALMKYTAGKKGIEPVAWFIDENQIPELDSVFISLETRTELPETLFGIKLNLVEGLDRYSDSQGYLKFYENMGGTFPFKWDDRTSKKWEYSLVILAGKDKAILGCY